ncbi:MAG: FAD-binding protein [Candidatus Limnocylindrales bacterium]
MTLTAERLKVDLLVAGAGMAGLCAAAAAAEAGARVGVVEKLPQVGGSAVLSAGMLWTARDFTELQQRMPDADAALGRALTSDFSAAVEWVRATGTEMFGPIDGPYFGFGRGWQIDVGGLFSRCVRIIEGHGGWIVRDTAVKRLLRDEAGRISGVATQGPDGSLEVDATAVLLATGGFQGDPALVAAFIGPHADRMLVRSNPGSVGDGFRMARDAGASASRSLSGFYGHLMPSPIDDFGEPHFLPLTQYHSIYLVLVDRNGRRFIDESRGDEYANQALLALPDQRAVLLADDAMHQRYVVTAPYPRGEVVDRFAEAARAGARYAVRPDLESLIAAVAEWGVPAADLRRTLDGHARAARGEEVSVDAPMPRQAATLASPPFHALEVQPAITFTLGGIRTDDQGQALDHDGRPVAGLYAAGADAGGVYHVGYGGGLALGLVFGRRAAHAALALSQSPVGLR